MSVFYDEIKKDIENLKANRNNKDFKSIVTVTLSESRLNHLFSLINNQYNENYPNLIQTNLSLNNLDDLERLLDNAEDTFGIDVANSIINDLNKTQMPNLSLLDNKNDKEYLYFAELDKLVSDTIKNHYEFFNTDMDPNYYPKELIIALQKEAKDLIKDKDNNIQHEYQFIKEFTKRPGYSFVNRYKNIFKFDTEKDRNLFIKDIDRIISVTNVSKEGLNKENEFLDKLTSKGKYETTDLASNLYKVITDYYQYKVRMEEEEPDIAKELPVMGKFLYDTKIKLGEIVMNDDIELGTDKYSSFIKSYLDDPVKCINDYEDYKNRNIAKNDLFETNEININFKNDILEEKDNYDICSNDNKDKWNDYQEYKKAWFMNYFKPQMKNLSINEILDNNKGGFFENLFGTTSNEYKSFSLALANMIENGPGKGDLVGLKQLAQNYLAHKLDSYNFLSHGYDDEEIECLDETGKGRVKLCLSVIDAIDNAKEAIDDKLNPKEFKYNEYESPLMHDEYWSNKINDDFQNNLKNDSEIEESELNTARIEEDSQELSNDNDLNNSK